MNKTMKSAIVAAATLMAAISSQAANITVTWDAFQSTGVALAGGGITPVPQGNTIQIGYFTIAPTIGSSSLANFVPWATSTINDGFDGFWSTSSTLDEAATATGVNGGQIYLVVQAPGSQLGIYSSSLSSWKFPTSASVPNFTSIDLQDLVTGAGTAGNALAGSAQIIFGSGVFFNAGDSSSYLKLGVVPEPSTALLVGAGLLGLVGLRRRSSK